jgi:hypothetical protein
MGITDKDPIKPLDVPDTVARLRIALRAAVGNDDALPVADRRVRANISDLVRWLPGSTVRVGQEERAVLGPGRGEGWALLGWTEGGVDCYGTFLAADCTYVSGPVGLPLGGETRT